MFGFFYQSSIKRITFLLIIFSGIFAFIFACIVIFNEKMEFRKDIEKAKSEYMQNKKDIIVAQSLKIYKMIEYYSGKKNSNLELQGHVGSILETIFKDPLELTYPFVFSLDDNLVYDPILLRHKDEKLSLLKLGSQKSILEQIRKISQKGGGFFEFKSFYDNDAQANSSLIFIRRPNKQGWIVGTGAYLDDFDSVLAQKTKESENKITSFILKITTLTFVLYVISIMKYRFLTQRLSREIATIDNSFKEASKTYKFIDKADIHLDEFKEIVTYANSMIETIKTNTTKLQALNANLEKIVEDKTSKLKQSAKLSKSLLKDQDKFINNALHEINTPLSIILMNTEMYHLKHDRNPYLEKIEAAVKVLETVNEDLNYIAKKDTLVYKKEIVDFSAYLKGRIEYFFDVAYQSELRFTCKIEEDVFIDFNEVELSRILDNNISNAIKYSYSNTNIDISLKTQNKIAQFAISNQGDSIKSSENLFNRYYRENSARGGFGLGLNIVREICEKNSVNIEVNSKSGNTTFKYEFKLRN